MHKFCKLFAYNPAKEICTFLVFLNHTSGSLKFCTIFFRILEMTWSWVLLKCIFVNFWNFFFKYFYHRYTHRRWNFRHDCTKLILFVSEFNEFEPRLKPAKNRSQFSAGLNLEGMNTILSWTHYIWAAA